MTSQQPRSSPHVVAWTVALLASLLLWNLPYGAGLLYPFKLLSTWSHELAHGLTMMATGVGLDRMELYRDTSGLAFGNSSLSGIGGAVVTASGYMGPPAVGVAAILLASTAKRARIVLVVLAMSLGLTALLLVSNRFGQLALPIIAAPLLAIALLAPGRWAIGAVHVVGAQACVNALLDIRVLFRPMLVVDGNPLASSDAHLMAGLTFGTTDAWAVRTWAAIWLLWALLLIFVGLRAIRDR